MVDRPRDLDDLYTDPDAQARVGEAIAKQANKPRKWPFAWRSIRRSEELDGALIVSQAPSPQSRRDHDAAAEA